VHTVLIVLGVGAAIFAIAQLRINRIRSALVYGGYSVVFFATPWPRVLTFLACVGMVDGVLSLLSLIRKTDTSGAIQLTEKGKRHFLFIEIWGVAIRTILLVLAWAFIGF
jgi:hypothetical protein